MITIAGFNSSIDRVMRTPHVLPGVVARVTDVHARPGGKGLHAALTCAGLGARVRLVGVIDALNRRRFEDVLGAAGVEFCGVPVRDEIRTCIAVRDDEGGVTELLEPGPVVDAATSEWLVREVLDGASGGPVVLSGSLPRGMAPTTYRDMVATLKAQASACLVDTSGELLRLALTAGPDVVSPNRHEAEAVTGVRIVDTISAETAARRLVEAGAVRAVISLGPDGIVAGERGRACVARAPARRDAHTLGAGDSLVGAMAVAIERGLDVEQTLRLAVACATASVADANPGVVPLDEMARLGPHVRFEWLPVDDDRADTSLVERTPE